MPSSSNASSKTLLLLPTPTIPIHDHNMILISMLFHISFKCGLRRNLLNFLVFRTSSNFVPLDVVAQT